MKYFLWVDGKETGPYSGIDMRAAVHNKSVDEQTLARLETESEWMPIQEALNKPAEQKPSVTSDNLTAIQKVSRPGITRLQGSVIVVLLSVGLGLPLFSFIRPVTRWEYKTIIFLADEDRVRTGDNAVLRSSIKVDNMALEAAGQTGWEIATSYLEMETAFPNFGKSELVTGLQPNVRPQKLVIILKRPLK